MSGRELASERTAESQPDSPANPERTGIPLAESTVDPAFDRLEHLRSILELFLVLFVVFGTSIFASIAPLFGSPALRGSTYSLLCLMIQVGGGLMFLVYVLVSSDDKVRQRFTRDRLLGVSLGATAALWPSVWNGVLMLLAWFGASGNFVRQTYGVYPCLDKALGLFVLAYLLHRRGRSYADIGLRWDSKSAALAAPLFLAGLVLYRFQSPITFWFGQTFVGSGWTPPDIDSLLFRGKMQVTAVLDALLNGFCEELVVRAFAMTAILTIFRRQWLAIVISVAVQISYHFYQGVPLALSHIPLFTLYALFYARTRLILPVALAHSLTNLLSLWHYGVHPTSSG